jgi:hypothetical protein
MDRKEKEDFIEEILEVTKEKIMAKLDKIPEDWDGFELRQLIADYTREQIAYVKMDKKRFKEYENTRMVENL